MRWSRPRRLLLVYALAALAAGAALGLAMMWPGAPGHLLRMGLVGTAVSLVAVAVLAMIWLILSHVRRR